MLLRLGCETLHHVKTVNSLNRIFRLAGWGFLISRAVFALGWRSFGDAVPAAAPPRRMAGAIPLYRDPCCGAFVSPEISLTLEHAGRTNHFCSAECRERYLLSLPRAVRA